MKSYLIFEKLMLYLSKDENTGKSIERISKEIGCSWKAVRDWLVRLYNLNLLIIGKQCIGFGSFGEVKNNQTYCIELKKPVRRLIQELETSKKFIIKREMKKYDRK